MDDDDDDIFIWGADFNTPQIRSLIFWKKKIILANWSAQSKKELNVSFFWMMQLFDRHL